MIRLLVGMTASLGLCLCAAPAGPASASLPAGRAMALTVTSVEPGQMPYDPTLGNRGIPVEVVRYRLARVPTTGYVCRTVVRRHGMVVGRQVSVHGTPGPGSPPLPPGVTPRNQAETVQLSVPTFKGVPGDATVVCRPGGSAVGHPRR